MNLTLHCYLFLLVCLCRLTYAYPAFMIQPAVFENIEKVEIPTSKIPEEDPFDAELTKCFMWYITPHIWQTANSKYRTWRTFNNVIGTDCEEFL
ncbi:hypothetical protein L596_019374 [Steinernema carpocapsae]|uniref:Uncharacterized protein n=1 Tax=Steinernema carpocapsae TaxID=34508 RepID=A0A4U5MQB0_STECR|nr:hypothetical protein L596_019374 [Steinernema carpocapsae]